MKYNITQRPDWLPAVRKTFRFFTGRDYVDEKLEERIVFYCQVMENHGLLHPGKTIVDLGAGICWFDPLLKLLGADIRLVDDFGGGGGVDNTAPDETKDFLTRYLDEWQFEMHEQNILKTPLPFENASVDAVTCFHCLEHWHNSPKRLFKEITRILKPGGFLFLATPNAVNLRKRITVPLGMNNWSSLDEWYEEEPVFRGHVREPILGDLRNICELNGLKVVAQYGRNFIGRDSLVLAWIPKPIRHRIAAGTQHLLQTFPTLCSDIHVVGRKPA
ncbi:MAG: class I SAM-dependent methyltransferase [Verrucomicrobiota bacterium]